MIKEALSRFQEAFREFATTGKRPERYPYGFSLEPTNGTYARQRGREMAENLGRGVGWLSPKLSEDIAEALENGKKLAPNPNHDRLI